MERSVSVEQHFWTRADVTHAQQDGVGTDGARAKEPPRFRRGVPRLIFAIGGSRRQDNQARNHPETLELEVVALHEEARTYLQELAPHMSTSHLATANYLESASAGWDTEKTRSTLRLADYVAGIRVRQHLVASSTLLVISSGLAFLCSNLARIVATDAPKKLLLQLAVFLTIAIVLNELLGKNFLVDRLRERRDAWRSAAKTLLRKTNDDTKRV